MTTSKWITNKRPTNSDADFRGLIQIPKMPQDLNYSGGKSIALAAWVDGMPWRLTHNKRPAKPKQLKLMQLGDSKICKTCRYWQKWAKPGGECKRNSPQAVLLHVDVDDTEHFAIWPGTDDADWCGEWEARQ
jgi:hypothetical protein